MNSQRGFTALEFVVGLAVFGIIISGLYVLVTNMSDDTSSDSPATSIFTREVTVIDQLDVHNPEIITTIDGRFRMVMHRQNEIISAISTDGATYTIEPGVRLPGAMPALVEIESGLWRMYFVDGPVIRSALTTDGYDFTVEDGERLVPGPSGLDMEGLIHPSVVKLPDGTYKMFYDGVTDDKSMLAGPSLWTIMSASSHDGLEWVKDDGARINLSDSKNGAMTGAWSPHIEFNNGMYELYFSSEYDPISHAGIWRATSSDGLTFTIDPQPVLGREPGFNDTNDTDNPIGGPPGVPQDPFILHLHSGSRLFYWTPDGGILSAWKE